jgi:putative ABC transport system ATP-binding protein
LPQTTLIQIRDLTRRDAKTQRLLLDKVNLSIRGGQRIGLVGSSGSGKSSLLRAIAKLDRCECGEIRFNGELICRDAVPTYRRQVIYLPQRSSFVSGTVRENLELPFGFAAATEQFDPSRVDRWLGDLAKSRELLSQPVEQLSGGEQQIVALIRAIALSPQVLLLDEPTASLDPAATRRFEELVLAWFQESESNLNRTFVWTSHDADQIQRMTTQRVEISDGVLAAEQVNG